MRILKQIEIMVVVAALSPAVAAIEPTREIDLGYPGLGTDHRTRVMVLATIHLDAEVRERSEARGIPALLDALAAFNPDVIAVERLTGETIDAWGRLSPTYDAVLDTFAGNALPLGKAAQRALVIDRLGAENRLQALLDAWASVAPEKIPPADRKKAAVLSLAAYDDTSAVLQWSYLPPDQRMPDDVIPPEVADGLSKALNSPNETIVIGVALARRLGRHRVYPVDDQSDALFQLERGDELMAELGASPEFAKLQESVLFKELPKRIEEAKNTGDLLGFYRWINSPEFGKADLDAQWHIFLRANLPSGLDRARAALWEERNLRIAANIRRAAAYGTGKRVLVIIGASHKPFLDAYLRQMMDVEVVDAAGVLSP